MNDESLVHIAAQFRSDVAALPPSLRRLLDDELAAGNTIEKVGHYHPAPPVGAFVMLARPVTTRARQNSNELRFHDRNSSLYSGEFTDEQRHFFILEPPGPPPEEPDMDAIRAAAGVGARGSASGATPAHTNPDSAVARFDRSRVMDYEKWHDGIGFDLDALREMTEVERADVARSLTPPSGWRDVEALAAIDSEQARDALRRAAASGSNEVRLAVSQHAPELLDEEARSATLIHALKTGQLMDGLTSALDQAEEFHPPAVLKTLWQGLLERPGDIAYNFAATLGVIYGGIESSADWSIRPLLLRFNSDDRAARLVARNELAELLGATPEMANPTPD